MIRNRLRIAGVIALIGGGRAYFGGARFNKFVADIKNDAVAHLSKTEQPKLKPILEPILEKEPEQGAGAKVTDGSDGPGISRSGIRQAMDR